MINTAAVVREHLEAAEKFYDELSRDPKRARAFLKKIGVIKQGKKRQNSRKR